MLLVIVEFTLISRPPKVIAAYVFAQYFFFLFLVGWLVYAGRVAGMLVHLGDLVLGRGVTQAAAGGCRADSPIVISTQVLFIL